MVPRLSAFQFVQFMLYAACFMPIRPSQLRLGPNRSFTVYFIQIIRGRLVSAIGSLSFGQWLWFFILRAFVSRVLYVLVSPNKSRTISG